jgi:hypothetical protein
VAEIKDSPFPDVKDPDALSVEDRERYLEYWASRTPNERLSELQRLRVAKYGDAANTPIKKVLEVVKVDWA